MESDQSQEILLDLEGWAVLGDGWREGQRREVREEKVLKLCREIKTSGHLPCHFSSILVLFALVLLYLCTYDTLNNHFL